MSSRVKSKTSNSHIQYSQTSQQQYPQHNKSSSSSSSNWNSQPVPEIKVVVVGDGYTGKTTLCLVYKDGKYPDDPYVPTIFENYAASVTCDGRRYTLNLFDSAGQEEYDQLRIMAYPNTNVFILCFSVVDPDSYQNILTKWIPELALNAPSVPILIVGTKIDLRQDRSTLAQLAKKGQRPVTQAQGEELARSCPNPLSDTNTKTYIECSSMRNFNVREVFEKAVQVHVQFEREEDAKRRRLFSRDKIKCSWLASLFCCTTKSSSSSASDKKHRRKTKFLSTSNKYAA